MGAVHIRVRISETATTTSVTLRRAAARRRRSFYVRAAKCRCYFAYNILCDNKTFCTRLNMKVNPIQSWPHEKHFIATNLYGPCRVKRVYFYSLKPGCAIGRWHRQPQMAMEIFMLRSKCSASQLGN